MLLFFRSFLHTLCENIGADRPPTKKGFRQEALVAGRGASLSLLAEPPCPQAGWCEVIKLTLSPTLDNALLFNSREKHLRYIIHHPPEKARKIFQDADNLKREAIVYSLL